ncbi:hypothetical protein [Nocardioides maradonensis]
MGLLSNVAGVGVGAAAGWASGELARRMRGRAEVVGIGGGLVVAALIYPAARRSVGTGGLVVEAAVVAATGALAASAAHWESATARRVLAGGWASHALFDALRGASPDSRLPGWYPAVCAGYDVAIAARVAR